MNKLKLGIVASIVAHASLSSSMRALTSAAIKVNQAFELEKIRADSLGITVEELRFSEAFPELYYTKFLP